MNTGNAKSAMISTISHAPRRRSLRARPPLATGDRKLVPATPHDVGLALQRGLRGQRTSESGRGCRRRSPRKRDRRRYPVFLVLGSLYSRTAENSNSRKLGFRYSPFSETELPVLSFLGNLETLWPAFTHASSRRAWWLLQATGLVSLDPRRKSRSEPPLPPRAVLLFK